jgi:hypothetical protein
MKGSFVTFALRFAAAIILFAPAVTAQAQGTSQMVCRDVQVPARVGAMGPNEHPHTERVCNTVYYQPPPPPPPEPPPRHTTGSACTAPC